MPKYSTRSQTKLAQCHPLLQQVFNQVIKTVDNTIIEGHRPKAKQNSLFSEGKSQLKYPKGKHNSLPSLAVDAAPYPINWNDRERATLFAGYVLGVAAEMGIKLRWGGDWNMNFETKDNNFDDLWHFELVL
ncbi:peptidase M15 [Psychromonas hadalis]|uniref:peptidase M15 n=1 Tax=Psychromonas hadalis TaxID=211669 RepID=UPI0003B544F3|nr:peptidase M15 [Psychromonas hadalis]